MPVNAVTLQAESSCNAYRMEQCWADASIRSISRTSDCAHHLERTTAAGDRETIASFGGIPSIRTEQSFEIEPHFCASILESFRRIRWSGQQSHSEGDVLSLRWCRPEWHLFRFDGTVAPV